MLFRVLLLLLLAAPLAPAAAYSVLTHQAVIDSTWDNTLEPQLRRHYPGATAEELNEARSYAYGGSILQDMGYYPLGSKLFTNLTHYVRAGDFVRNLLRQARNRNEYAFALGALAHYAADNVGHPEGTNQIMPTMYPVLRARFGPVVTYEQATKRHTELEFSFDVVQVAAGRYRTQEYHKFIGFRVSKPVLERAFQQNVWAGAGAGDSERGRQHCYLPLCREPAATGHRPRRLVQPAPGNPQGERPGPAARLPLQSQPARVPQRVWRRV